VELGIKGVIYVPILIRGCKLFDSVNKTITEDVNILIVGDHIEEISHTHIDTPPSGHIIDAGGCTVIPGLVNLHTHPQRRHARFMGHTVPFRIGASAVEDLPNTQRLLWAVKNCWNELLADGVTTMRAAGSKDCLNIELRDVFKEGMFHGPRILATGAILAITGGHGTRGINAAMEVDGADEVRKAVRMLLKAGADWIKLCVSGGLAGIHKGDHPSIVEFSYAEVCTATEEAHKRNRKVMVHGMSAESVKTSIKADVDCIEHGNLLDDEAISMMKEKGVFFVPTMSGIRRVYERERDGGSAEVAAMLWEVISPHESAVSKCIDAGILIGTGTDTLGFIHQEIQMLVDCGMSRSEALSAATIDSAKILGLEEEIGSVEVGKKADLLVLEGDPVQDLAALEKIREVIIAGSVVSWSYLTKTKEGY
jgi:imidazolonepropionase-like amidohydrolase